MLSAIEPRVCGCGRGYEPRRAPFRTVRAAGVATTLFVDDSQLAVPHRVENRLAQRRTNKEHTAVGVRRYLLGFGTLDAPVGRVGVPLHAGLVPGALADQHPCAAVATRHGHHRHLVEPIVGPHGRIGRHHAEPWAAMFASTSFIHASYGLEVSNSNSKRSTMSGSTSAAST